jgi:hypothetical protein
VETVEHQPFDVARWKASALGMLRATVSDKRRRKSTIGSEPATSKKDAFCKINYKLLQLRLRLG